MYKYSKCQIYHKKKLEFTNCNREKFVEQKNTFFVIISNNVIQQAHIQPNLIKYIDFLYDFYFIHWHLVK